MLCLDSDGRDLCELAGHDERIRFKNDELLSISLRNAEAYRKTGEKYSRWLSRRWIYNIPRSLSTEGIRPLGRLALADHISTVLEHLHQKLPALANEDDLLQSAKNLGMRADAEPRIVLIGSISGGIGSGAIPDLAYAIRTVLLEHGMSDRNITGILVHASADTTTDSILSVSNTYACIRELSHYAKLGYPGDESMGLPSFDGEFPAAFSDIYFLNTRQSQLAATATKIADYLFLDINSGCGEYFERVRNGRDEAGRQSFRCLGISHLDLQTEKIRSRFANHLRKRLFDRWLARSPQQEVLPSWHQAADSLFRGLAVDSELVSIGRRLAEDGEQADASPVATMTDRRAAPLDEPPGEFDWIDPLPQTTPVTDPVTRCIRPLSTALWARVGCLLDDPQFRFAGALYVHQQCLDALARRSAKVDARLARLAAQIKEDAEGDQPRQPPCQLLSEMEELQYRKLALQKITQGDEGLVQEFHSVRALLETSASAIQNSLATDPEIPSTLSLGSALTQQLSCQVEPLLEELDSVAEKHYFVAQGGLRQAAANGSSAASHLADFLEAEMRRLVTRSLRGIDVNQVLQTALGETDKLRDVVAKHLQEALPSINDCGGSIRLLIAAPPTTSPDPLAATAAELFRCPATFLNQTDGDVTFCFESAELSSSDLGLRLIDECPEATRYVDRIPGRSDVEWIPLTGLA